MEKVLVLNGSPKAVSDTMVLANAFLKGMGEYSEFEWFLFQKHL